jgi:hypothetical protein
VRLSYDLLLDLCRGRALVVEQLTPQDREALRLETPLTRFIDEAARSGKPRHIVLTGNAGDGKTFAALTSQTQALSLVLDASAHHSGGAALSGLTEELARRLAANERLLVAINRGQLERLAETVKAQATPLARFVADVRAQAVLHDTWPPGESEIAVVDLGLCDWTSDEVVDAMLHKAAGVDLSSVQGNARIAAERACEALGHDHVRRWVRAVLAGVRGEGRHVTMRQLWSFVAFLVTGGIRGDDAARTLRAEDSVGARIFSYDARRTPLETACTSLDPVRSPQPDITRWLLNDEVSDRLAALPGLSGLVPASSRYRDGTAGVAVARAAVVHDRSQPPEDKAADNFTALVAQLAIKSGWQPSPGVTQRLLKGIYQSLGLWCADSAYPAWQILCYDSALYERAPAVTTGEVSPSILALALPRPPPAAEQALGKTWRPPYIWMGVAGGAEGVRLRLPPRLFNVLYDADPSAEIDRSDALVLGRWLSRLPAAPRPSRAIFISRGPKRARPLSVVQDDISQRLRIEDV